MADNTPSSLNTLERLHLANQFSILERLDPDQKDHWAMCRKVIESGYTIMYGEVFQHINSELEREECEFVFDVLNMYRDLGHSYAALTDKGGIDADDVEFHGFDGNNETALYFFIEFLKEQGRWSETLEKCGMNTHYPVVDRYRKMIPIWKDIRAQYDPVAKWHDLTADEVKKILFWKDRAVSAS